MAGKAFIPAHVISARGRKITLLDGSTPSLVYGFSSIMRLEEDFGSIDRALAAVAPSDDAMPSLTAIVKVMCAGLEHETVVLTEQVDDRTQTVQSGLLSDPDVLRHLLDSQAIEQYSDAIGEAFELAFPAKTEDGENGENPPLAPSPGGSGTTSPPSYSGAQTLSSGG